MAILDLDEFKKVNDTYGHPVGDELIKVMAGVLRRFGRDRIVASHWGGDEFAVALTSFSFEEGKGFAEQVRLEMKTAAVTWLASKPTTDIAVTASAGGASVRRADFDYGRLIDNADTQLYAAKENGRDRTEWLPA